MNTLLISIDVIIQFHATIHSKASDGRCWEEICVQTPQFAPSHFSEPLSPFDESSDVDPQSVNQFLSGTMQGIRASDERSTTVFSSLMQLLRDVDGNDGRLRESMIFIAESIAFKSCSVRDLCTRYSSMFSCESRGHLILINLRYCQMSGVLELSALPQTVYTLILAHNDLSSIDLIKLRGSSLRSLNIESNPNLVIDLNVFQNKEDNSDPLPLQTVTLNLNQIVTSLRIEDVDRDHKKQKIGEWMQSSTLKELRICESRRLFMTFKKVESVKNDEDTTHTSHEYKSQELLDQNQDHFPLHSPSPQTSLEVFQSLCTMMEGVHIQQDRMGEAITFITASVALGRCSVSDLCFRFGITFKCDDQGRLSLINLRNCKMIGNLNLSALPRTVNVLILEHNDFGAIGDLKDLRGSSLRTLNIRKNPNLIIDLSIFQNKQDPVPLENLTLNRIQIIRYLGILDPNQRKEVIGKWVRTSTLKELRIYDSRSCLIVFTPDGWTEVQLQNKDENKQQARTSCLTIRY